MIKFSFKGCTCKFPHIIQIGGDFFCKKCGGIIHMTIEGDNKTLEEVIKRKIEKLNEVI